MFSEVFVCPQMVLSLGCHEGGFHERGCHEGGFCKRGAMKGGSTKGEGCHEMGCCEGGSVKGVAMKEPSSGQQAAVCILVECFLG